MINHSLVTIIHANVTLATDGPTGAVKGVMISLRGAVLKVTEEMVYDKHKLYFDYRKHLLLKVLYYLPLRYRSPDSRLRDGDKFYYSLIIIPTRKTNGQFYRVGHFQITESVFGQSRISPKHLSNWFTDSINTLTKSEYFSAHQLGIFGHEFTILLI